MELSVDGMSCVRAKGVFAALTSLDWYQLVVPKAGARTGPGVSGAIGANRISSLPLTVGLHPK